MNGQEASRSAKYSSAVSSSQLPSRDASCRSSRDARDGDGTGLAVTGRAGFASKQRSGEQSL